MPMIGMYGGDGGDADGDANVDGVAKTKADGDGNNCCSDAGG